MLLSIALFFVYCWGFGVLAGFFVKESEDFLERNLMRLGIGLGGFLSFGLFLNLLGIPLDWKIFLAASLLIVLIKIAFGIKKIKNRNLIPKIKLNFYSLLVVVLFGVTLFMYAKGAFVYPWLEDDDSWAHAIGVKYVAVEKTVFTKTENRIRYADPYPPTYDMFLGLMHQTNNSLYQTMKLFNALIISLSIIFFFYFVKELTGSSRKAIFSAFALFAIPAYVSHFIWAISMSMAMFFVPFYCIEKIKDNKRWWLPSAIATAPALVSSPTHGAYFGIFLLTYLLVKGIIEKRLLIYEYLGGFGGVLLSSLLWWIPITIRHGIKGAISGVSTKKIVTGEMSIFNLPGTGDCSYSVSDFLCSPGTPCYKGQNMINNPIGIGLVLSLLLMLFLIYMLFKHYKELKKYAVPVLLGTLAINAAALIVLYKGYIKKYFPDCTRILLEGPIPFFEFFWDNIFLIGVLFFLSFLIFFMLWLNFKNILRHKYWLIALIWLILSFYAVKAAPFSYKLSPFRAWMIFAIPAAVLCGESIELVNNIVKATARAFIKNKIIIMTISILVLAVVGFGIIKSSFIPKYKANTSQWGPGGFWTYAKDESGRVFSPELIGYVWFKDNIAPNERVFTFSNNALVIGFDKFICHWCKEVTDYQNIGLNESAEQNYNWLKEYGYKYVIIDGQAAERFGADSISKKLQDYADSGKFNVAFNNNAFILFEVA